MSNAMSTVHINATDYIQPHLSVVDCAIEIGRVVTKVLKEGGSVRLSFRGVRGVSTSFCNVIIAAVADALGGRPTSDRFDVDIDSALQRQVYQRSFQAHFPPST